MTCQQFEEKLADYLGDELAKEDAEHLERHMKDCEACRNEATDLQQGLQALRSLSVPRLTTSERTAHGARRWLSYAAILVFGVFLGYSVRPGDSKPDLKGPSITDPSLHESWLSARNPGPDTPRFARNLAAFSRALGHVNGG